MAINQHLWMAAGTIAGMLPGKLSSAVGAVAADPRREASADSTGSTASLSLTRATLVAQNRISAVI